MPSRRDIAIRLERALHDLGSLGSAAGIVLFVLAFALVAMNSGGMAARLQEQAARRAEKAPAASRAEHTAQLFLEAEGADGPPIVYAAHVELKRWENRDQHIVEATVNRADPLVQKEAPTPASSSSVARELSDRLKGREVLAAVTADVATRLVLPEEANVRLVVTPKGGTATLLIDGVVEPGKGYDSLPAAPGAIVAASLEPAVVSPVSTAGVASAATPIPKPVVTSMSRYWGKPGTVVTIEGRNFGRASTRRWVTCGGVRATWRSWSSTSVTFVVPSTMKAPAYVGIVTTAGVSNGMYYIPFDPPVIGAITPREGAPGTVVTVTGSRFGSSQGSGWVTFAGRSAEVVSWSDTQIKVVVPKGAEAGYAGVVAHGLCSNGMLYGPYGMPYLSALSSRQIYPGLQVTLTGRDFGGSRGRVVCGGASVVPDSWSPTQVMFTVPSTVTNGYVGIQRPDGSTSNGLWQFVVPRLDSLSAWWASPGTTVTLTGSGFGATQGSQNVFIGGRPVSSVTSWSDTRIDIVVPVDAMSGYVGVGTSAACSRGKYLLVETRASLDNVSPRHVVPGQQITLTGSGFGPQSATSCVSIAGTYHCLIVEWSDSRIVAIVPPSAINGYVGVNKRGVTSNGVWVQVLP